jgi:Protein of unknown function (DUF917)
MFCKLTDDLVFIMEGCGVLGTVHLFDIFCLFFTLILSSQGGGGSPYSTYLTCHQILCDGVSIRIVDHKSLKDDDVVARGGKIAKALIQITLTFKVMILFL